MMLEALERVLLKVLYVCMSVRPSHSCATATPTRFKVGYRVYWHAFHNQHVMIQR